MNITIHPITYQTFLKNLGFFSFDLSVKIHIQVDDFQFLGIAYMDVDMKNVETADTDLTFI